MKNNSITQSESTVSTGKFDLSIFEVVEGRINLTKMCEYFGKEIRRWLQNPSSIAFLSALQADDGKSAIEILKGGNGEQGTFGTRDVALKVAQWISPEFEVFCIKKLDTLFQTGTVSLQPQLPANYLEALEALVESEKAKQQLALENGQLNSKVNRLMFVTKTYTATEIAKELNLKSANELNNLLSVNGYQYKVNGTWVLNSQYANLGYCLIKQEELQSGRIIYNRHFTQAGRDWILETFNK